MQENQYLYNDVEIMPFCNKLTMGVKKPDVQIEFKPEDFKRLVFSDNTEMLIDQQWSEKCANNSRLFNGTKFRLHQLTLPENSDEKAPLLKVGITTYKELLGTHYGPQCEELIKHGILKKSDPYAYMSNCIGVGALAVTQDDFVVLLKRANWTGEAAGKVDRPGGHPEPELAKKRQKGTIINCDSGNYNLLEPNHVLDEIFLSPQLELMDEVNIPIENQRCCLLLGLLRDLKRGGRCGLDFLIKMDLTKEQVEEKYITGQQIEADESVGLLFISKSDIENWKLDHDLESKMTPHCIGGLKLLRLYWERSI